MSNISADWNNATPSQPRKRRAEAVCITCHSKKIKCDLQLRQKQGASQCSYCHGSGRHCELRTPKRAKQTATVDVQPSAGRRQPPQSSQESVSPAYSSAARREPQPQNASTAALSQTSPDRLAYFGQSDVNDSHNTIDIDNGFLQVYRQETLDDARNQTLTEFSRTTSRTHTVPPELLPIFIDTYFDNCYAFCPVLDRDTLPSDAESSLLVNALALAASHVRPPMLPHDGPASYYNRARTMFYEDDEPNILISLKAVLLFYWWAPRSTSAVHRHSSWWWTSVVIRHAQVMNIHRDPSNSEQYSQRGIQRRIWWTAFSRERLTALCQSKPVIINLQDCNMPEPSLDDFPHSEQDRTKQEVFIYWVKLCGIIGDIAQHLSQTKASSAPFPSRLVDDLVQWVQSLPPHLILSIGSIHTSSFDKHVHQLHLPYLVAIIVLHLKRPQGLGVLPQALPQAVMAATCIARIFKDILARGDTRYLMPITSWYTGVTFIALLSASREESMRDSALADLAIVEILCKHLRNMWASATVIYNGFDRLREAAAGDVSSSSSAGEGIPLSGNFGFVSAGCRERLFPFATSETSAIASTLLGPTNEAVSHAMSDLLTDSSILDLQDWLTHLSEDDFVLPGNLEFG